VLQRLGKKLDTNAILAEFADIVAENSLSVERLLPALARFARKVVDYELFAVLLRVKGSRYLEVVYATGHGQAKLKNRKVRIGEGIVGAAAASRKTIVVNEVTRDRRYVAAVDEIQSEMSVPLIARGRLIGVMDFESTRPNAFGSRERSLLRLISSRIAMTVDGARMHAEKAVWNRNLATLVRLSHEFSTVLRLDDLLEGVAALARRLVRYDAFSIFLIDPEAGILRNHLSVRHDRRLSLQSLPLDAGIVGAAARRGRPLLVRDTSRDPRYVAAIEGIRSEVAVPLVLRDRVIGVLDLESEKTGFFDQQHVRMLALLGPQIAAAIENARLYESVSAHERRLTGDLAAARELQQSLLPDIPKFPGLDIGARNEPAISVSGDTYDFFSFGTTRLRVLIGDVSGKGTAAALYAAMASGVLNHLALPEREPGEMLAMASNALANRKPASTYLAATVVDWLPLQSRFVISGAGAPAPLLLRSGRAEVLPIEGYPVGLIAGARYEEHPIPADPGDILVLASDGILECCDPSGQEYGYQRLAETVAANCALSAQDLVGKIFEDARRHAGGGSAQDDQTVVLAKVLPRSQASGF
jgi:sigma-B regulation protein RsbU (phosphoserine phosphatase)